MSAVLQCLVCDDEPHALDLLRMYISRTPFLNLHSATTSPLEALQLLRTEPIDLLFLDIQMEELNGLQLLEVLSPDCEVILTTAYPEYALQGYELAVMDYLLKPFSFERFLRAAGRARALNPDPPRRTVDSGEQQEEGHIFIKGDAKNKFHRLALDEILFVEGLKNYVQFICKDRRVISLQNLKDLELQLPSSDFLRIHRSYLVHLSHVQEVEGHQLKVGDVWIPVGQTYRDGFYAFLKNRTIGRSK